MNYIPTYQEALEIVKAKGGIIFYETKHFVDGYQISIFNYRLAKYNDFISPIPGKNIDAKELRGLTFVFNSDGSLYKRFLMLKKFWNINQVPETQYDEIKKLKIKSVYNKEDGSLISFIKLANGRILPKTKASLDNEQVTEVNEILKSNDKIRNYIETCLDNDIIPFFEYVSFKNKIVLNYEKTDLILLRLRNNITGDFIDVKKVDGINIVPKENYTNIDVLLKLSETLENKEGWVIEFENDYLVKHKTNWYFIKHRLLDDLCREDSIISMHLEETLDDVIVGLHPINDEEKINWIENITTIVNEYIKQRTIEVEELLTKYNGSMKDFAISYRDDVNFAIATNVIKGINNGEDKSVVMYETIKKLILRKTYRLEEAKNFIKNKIL